MKALVALFAVLVLFVSVPSQSQTGDAVLPGVALVRFSPAAMATGASALGTRLAAVVPELGITSIKPLLLPVDHAASAAPRSAETQHLEAVLSRVMIVSFAAASDPRSLCARLATVDGVEYAEPWYTCPPLGPTAVPDDSLFGQQAFLTLVKAAEAWDITTGDPQIVIGVADTDIKWDHPDLEPNIWINPGENGTDGQGRSKRSNGVDDDANGLVDDWHGWDFGGANNTTPDNDTRSASGGHGTSVAGLAAAATNNHIGIASIGHSCRILPIKIGADGGGNLAWGLQAMDYASRMGCKVLNASWGSTGFSQTMKDMVDLATSRGTLIVGGAGNNGNIVPFYPASFPNVLDATVCNANDIINTGATYGPDVDVVCPGDGALTTSISGGYGGFGATSAAAPLASGLAGLVASHFPAYTPAMIRERIRVTCDNIDAQNPKRVRFAGRGRINALRALTDPPTPSVRITSFFVQDPNSDGRLDQGEEIELTVNVHNHLAATPDKVTLTLEPVTNASTVELITRTVSINAIPADADAGTAFQPFVFRIAKSTVYDAVVIFRVDFSSGAYQDFDFVQVTVNPSWNSITNNDFTLGVQASGTIGFLDYPDNLMGTGMQYLDAPTDFFQGALMLATDQAHIVDVARDEANFLARNTDFRTLDAVALTTIGRFPAAVTRFDDARADSARRLSVEVVNEVLDPSPDGIVNVLYSIYKVHNTGSAPLSNLRCGLFMDYGGYPRYYSGNVYYDSTLNAFTVTKSRQPMFASFVVPDSTQPVTRPGFWAFNNDQAAAGNPFGTYDGFTAAEKWLAMSSYKGNPTCPGGSVGFVLTAPPQTIAPNQTGIFVFGHVLGTSLGDLKESVRGAIDHYRSSVVVGTDATAAAPDGLAVDALWPNPCSRTGRGTAWVSFRCDAYRPVAIGIWNALGVRVLHIEAPASAQGMRTQALDIRTLPAGVYLCRLTTGGAARTLTLHIID